MFQRLSFPLFRAFGFPVRAHWSLAVALALAAWTGGGVPGVVMSVLLFASVLLHELGHALVARRLDVAMGGIELHLFGGVAEMLEPPRSPRDEVKIAVAGPLVSVALAAAAFAAWKLTGVPVLGWLASANLGLALFNLIPALPLDGGRVLRGLLAERQGILRGTRTAVVVSRVLAVAIGLVGLMQGPWLIALAVLVWMLGSRERAQIETAEAYARIGFGPSPWAAYDARWRGTHARVPDEVVSGQARPHALWDDWVGASAVAPHRIRDIPLR
jgi:Zn-dependent protease